jgi:predicted MFS family arabinose efflux permease
MSVAAATFQFAAMFAVFSNAMSILTEHSSTTDGWASLLMVVFDCGGLAGALIAGSLIRQHLLSYALAQPLVLAIAYSLLYCSSGMSGATTAVAVLCWGATHGSGMLVSRATLERAIPCAPEVTAVIYVLAGCLGVLVGVFVASLFAAIFGPFGFLFCGLVLSLLSFVLVGAQVSVLEMREAIVATTATD